MRLVNCGTDDGVVLPTSMGMLVAPPAANDNASAPMDDPGWRTSATVVSISAIAG